jgi:outer membrane protein
MNAETIPTVGHQVREHLLRGIRVELVSALFVWGFGAGQAAAEEIKAPWKVTVGAGMVSLPEYPGSEESHMFPFPMINVSYGNFFIGNQGAGLAGIGLHLYHDSRWTLGAAIGPDVVKPRTEADDPRLQGLGDIPRTVRAGLLATYRHEWLTVRASVSSDINDED